LYFSPHYDPNINPNIANTMTKLYQKYIASNWYNGGNTYSGIIWEYDIEHGTVTLNAEFGPKLIVPSTSKDVIYSDGTSGHWIDFYSTFTPEVTLINPSGSY